MTTSKDFPGSASSSSVEKENREENQENQNTAQQQEEAPARVNPSLREEENLLITAAKDEEENRANSSSREKENSPPTENRANSSSKEEDNLPPTGKQLNIPLGYRFHPNDTELIMKYLVPKILGRQLPVANIIQEFDMYKYDPDQLLVSEYSYVKRHQAYFFAKQRFSRGAGMVNRRYTNKGIWKARGGDVKVYNRCKEIVGYKKVLIYYRGKEPKEEKTCWTMYEYRVPPNMVTNEAVADDRYVVCRIKYKDASKKENEQVREVEKSDHSSSSSSSEGEENETINGSQRLTLDDFIELINEEKVKPRNGRDQSNGED